MMDVECFGAWRGVGWLTLDSKMAWLGGRPSQTAGAVDCVAHTASRCERHGSPAPVAEYRISVTTHIAGSTFSPELGPNRQYLSLAESEFLESLWGRGQCKLELMRRLIYFIHSLKRNISSNHGKIPAYAYYINAFRTFDAEVLSIAVWCSSCI